MDLASKKGGGSFLLNEVISCQARLWTCCLNLHYAPANCVDLIATRNLYSILTIFV